MRIAVCLVLLAGLCSAQVNTVLSKANKDAAVSSAKALLAKNEVNALDAYFATVILSATGAQATSKAACASLAATAISVSASALDVSFALRASSFIGCESPVNAGVVTKVQAGLDSGKIGEVYGAVASLPLLTAAKQELTVSWPSIVDIVTELAEEDGKFRESKAKGATSSALNAGYAYAVLAAAWPSVEGSPASKQIVAAMATLGELLNDAVGSEATTLELGSGDSATDKLITTAFVVSGVSAVAAAVGDGVEYYSSAAEVAAFARYFLSNADATGVRSAGAAFLGVSSIIAGPDAPLSVRAVDAVVVDGAATPLTIAVTDLFGATVGTPSVTLKSLTRASDSSVLIKDQKLVASAADGSLFPVDLSSKKPTPGAYNIKLSVDVGVAAYAPLDGATLSIKVLGKAVLSTATVLVSDGGKDTKGASATATYPKAAADVLTLNAGSFLHVTFDVKSGSGSPLSPHQVFVRLTSAATKPSTFVATAEAPGSYRVSIDTSARDNLKAAVVAGVYGIEILVGDAVIQNPIVWKVGSVTINPPPAPPTQPEILYTKPLLHESDTTLKALPVIEHQFRVPDVRAPAAVSSAFAVLVASPLLLLIIGIFSFGGANLKRVAEVNPIAFIGFEVSLGAELALLVWYWVELNMFQVLVYLIPPTIAALFFGRSVLKALHTATAAAAAKPKKD